MADNRGGSGLLKTEDWLAVWLGFLIVVLVLVGLRPSLPTFRWATDSGFAAAVAEQKPSPSGSTWASEQPRLSTAAAGAVDGQASHELPTPSPSESS